MYERSTDCRRSKEGKEVYTAREAPGSQGMGNERKRSRYSEEVQYSPSYTVQVEEGPGAGSGDISEWETAQSRSKNKGTGRGEPETKGSDCHTDPGVDVVKKKDELGLANRCKGSVYSGIQRQRIIEEVEKLRSSGVKKSVALRKLGVCRSTYYGWFRSGKPADWKPSVLRLTDAEREVVTEKKKTYPHLSHRQISGYLRHDGYWVSESSCYRILRDLGWVFPQPFREAPWRVPRYEPFAPNQVWGEDWTILSIGGQRHYLLTIIDYFSRYIVAWAIVKTVSQREVKDLLVIAYINEGLEHSEQKPLLRLDRGSPNMAWGTRRLIRDLEMVISASRVNRPTDNARQERWYRTVKQDEIYCHKDYPSVDIARLSMVRYIEEYNEIRPHQALWNYPPGFVHRLGNKTLLLEHRRRMIQIAKERRLDVNRALMAIAEGGVSN